MHSTLLSLVAAVAFAQPHAPDTSGVMARGVSRALAEQRAAQLGDVRYALQLDLTTGDTVAGTARIEFTLRGPGDVILDFRGPRVGDVRVNGALATVENNGWHLRVPRRLLHAGRNEINLRFATLAAAAGAPIIRTRDETDGRTYLYTLLVPSDAEALFPCFDQPDLKARLTLALTVPAGWTAIANGRSADGTRVPGGSLLRFRESDPLPTYLFAFAAGPYARFDIGTRGTPLLVRASRAKEVEVDSLMDEVGSALHSLAAYFGIPYPFQQFQYLLAPAFPFGGMEHPGVTMFNEESFIFREAPTLNQRLARRATIYHEVAHQWFGDYVTMRWFDDLWLKEGFATYMAAKMQEREGLPNPWLAFYLRNKPLAYDVDASLGTTPVWQALDQLDQAKSNYGAIVYNKAPGVLKQLDYLVGDSAFRAGVHAFLAAHPYGNATWRDLLDAIGAARGRSLGDWGAQYILRPGMPIIEQHVHVADGRIARLVLAQRPAQPSLSGARPWPIRTQVVVAREGAPPTLLPVELTGDSVEVRAAAGLPAPDFVFANAGDFAYALALPDSASSTYLSAHIGSVRDDFLRAMLWGAQWDLVRETRLAPASFARTALRELGAERDEQIAGGILSRLRRVLESQLSAAQRDSLQPDAERVLAALAADSARAYGLRKNHLDAFIELALTPPALAHLDALLDSTTAAGLPLRQPSRWSIVTRLVAVGAPTAERRLAAEIARDTTPGGRRRAFVAGAARADSASKARYFARYFADSSLNEEWATASLRAFNDPLQHALTLPFLDAALDSLPWIQRNRRIFFVGSWLGALLGGQRDAAALARVDAFLSAHPSLAPDLRRKILQSRDDLERTVRIRARWAGEAPDTEAAPHTPARGG